MSSKVKKFLSVFVVSIMVLSGVFAVFSVPAKADQTFTLTYNSNNGTGATQTRQFNYMTPIQLPDAAAMFGTPTGATFQGWCLTADGSTAIYKKGDSYSPLPHSHTLYAIYTFDVTFDVNGGKMKDESEVTQQVVYGQHVTAPQAPSDTSGTSREGLGFAGWYKDLNVSADASNIANEQFNFAVETVTAPLTLHAVYGKSFYVEPFDNSTGNQGTNRGGTYKISTNSGTSYDSFHYFTLYSDKMTYPVTLTAYPDEEYHFVEWRKSSTNGAVVSSDQVLTINSAKEAEFCYFPVFSSDPMISDIFSDVNESDWYANAVKYVYIKNIMGGKGDIFDPRKPIKREEFVQSLYNHAGKPAVAAGAEQPFPDVQEGKYYYNAVIWAKANGITSGKVINGETVFGVGQYIKREELVKMLYEYCKSRGYEMYTFVGASDGYKDSAELSSWAKVAMDWGIHRGVLSGKGDKGADKSQLRIAPKENATRAECASMFSKILY